LIDHGKWLKQGMPVQSNRKGNNLMTTYKITRKQNISSQCLVCGLDNPLSLRARFYELDNGMLAGITVPHSEHQSYPLRVHGGMISAFLDEVIGRAINITEPETWAVTTNLEVKFIKPVPYDVELIAMAKIVSNNRKLFTGEAELILPSGEVAATGKAKYFKQNLTTITEADNNEFGWRPLTSEEDRRTEIIVPDKPEAN
jgi:uncharacterized protein (TIGR00369 family)